jgi:transposase
VPLRKLHFIDESGVNLSLTRLFARSPKGARVTGKTPSKRGENTTVIGSLNHKGIENVMTIEGSTNTEVFNAYVEHFLVPDLKRGDVVVMDNYGPHKSARTDELIKSKGARIIFLPPYHPEFNPIENAWSKMKSILRSVEARTKKSLNRAIGKAMNEISAGDALGWFGHCGYQVK